MNINFYFKKILNNFHNAVGDTDQQKLLHYLLQEEKGETPRHAMQMQEPKKKKEAINNPHQTLSPTIQLPPPPSLLLKTVTFEPFKCSKSCLHSHQYLISSIPFLLFSQDSRVKYSDRSRHGFIVVHIFPFPPARGCSSLPAAPSASLQMQRQSFRDHSVRRLLSRLREQQRDLHNPEEQLRAIRPGLLQWPAHGPVLERADPTGLHLRGIRSQALRAGLPGSRV